MSGSTWALLVVASRKLAAADDRALSQIEVLVARAQKLTSPLRTCAIVSGPPTNRWRALEDYVPPDNIFIESGQKPAIGEVLNCLREIKTRDSEASVIVIPADHCAVEETSWLLSARGALHLGSTSLNSVYLLHDEPTNDPRTSKSYPGICSSSVIIGSVTSLIDLCLGDRETTIIDMHVATPVTEAPARLEQLASTSIEPLKIVHITSVEEYENLQRGHYGRPPARVDVRI